MIASEWLLQMILKIEKTWTLGKHTELKTHSLSSFFRVSDWVS